MWRTEKSRNYDPYCAIWEGRYTFIIVQQYQAVCNEMPGRTCELQSWKLMAETVFMKPWGWYKVQISRVLDFHYPNKYLRRAFQKGRRGILAYPSWDLQVQGWIIPLLWHLRWKVDGRTCIERGPHTEMEAVRRSLFSLHNQTFCENYLPVTNR